jgi:hypothetical protein
MKEKTEKAKKFVQEHGDLVGIAVNSLVIMGILYTGKYIGRKELERKLTKAIADGSLVLERMTSEHSGVICSTGKDFLKWIEKR